MFSTYVYLSITKNGSYYVVKFGFLSFEYIRVNHLNEIVFL